MKEVVTCFSHNIQEYGFIGLLCLQNILSREAWLRYMHYASAVANSVSGNILFTHSFLGAPQTSITFGEGGKRLQRYVVALSLSRLK